MQAKADEPYARSKDYDLQHSKIVLKFEVEQKKLIGDVTHTLDDFERQYQQAGVRFRRTEYPQRDGEQSSGEV